MIPLDGYEYENETTIDPKLVCPICLQPFHRPKITLCEHIFCQRCIEVWHAKSATCPLCREISKNKHTKSVRNPVVLNRLGELTVTCVVCRETGIKRRDFDDHHCPQGRSSNTQDHAKCLRTEKRDDSQLVHISRLPFKFIHSRRRRIANLINESPTHSRITLRDQRLTDADMSLVVYSAIDKKRCKILDLGNNNIISYGVVHLADSLDKNNTLRVLSLHRNPLSEKSVRYLANKLAKSDVHLKWLDLESTSISDHSAEHLATMLATNRSLTGLWLSNNRISYRGVTKIASALARSNATLKYLDFENNQSIDDACLPYLLNMLEENRSLKTVYLNRCQLSLNCRRKLREIADTKPNFHLFL